MMMMKVYSARLSLKGTSTIYMNADNADIAHERHVIPRLAY
jgi:hypothetical protein